MVPRHKTQIRTRLLFAYLFSLSTFPAHSEVSSESKSMLDPSPMVSARASGMGGALSTSADNADAFYYNPASISGQIYSGKPQKEPFVRQVLFPRAGGTLNENATKLNSEFSAKGATSDSSAGATIVKAHNDKRQYARVSFAPVGLFLGNIGVVPLLDQQIAAIPKNTATSDVEFRYRSFSGILVGSSVSDAKGYLSLGASGSLGTLEETYATAPYIDMVDQKKRSDIQAANKKVYSAKSTNFGATLRLPNKANPTLAIVARDAGNTRLEQNGGGDPLILKEDLTVGFGVSPVIGKYARLNLSLESGYLTDKHQSAKKKFRSGLEINFGSEEGSRSTFALRVGGTAAGASFGAHLNLGLIGIEASNYGVDVGIDNERLIERRSSGVVYFDVASF